MGVGIIGEFAGHCFENEGTLLWVGGFAVGVQGYCCGCGSIGVSSGGTDVGKRTLLWEALLWGWGLLWEWALLWVWGIHMDPKALLYFREHCCGRALR